MIKFLSFENVNSIIINIPYWLNLANIYQLKENIENFGLFIDDSILQKK